MDKIKTLGAGLLMLGSVAFASGSAGAQTKTDGVNMDSLAAQESKLESRIRVADSLDNELQSRYYDGLTHSRADLEDRFVMLDSLKERKEGLIRKYDSLDLIKQDEIVKLELAAQTGAPVTIRKDPVAYADTADDVKGKPDTSAALEKAEAKERAEWAVPLLVFFIVGALLAHRHEKKGKKANDHGLQKSNNRRPDI